MHHIPRSVEYMEYNSKRMVWSRLCKTLAKFLAWKNCSLNSSKRSKHLSLVPGELVNLPTEFGKSLVFHMVPLVHTEITRPRWICSEFNDNCNIPSSEPCRSSDKFLSEIWHITACNLRRSSENVRRMFRSVRLVFGTIFENLRKVVGNLRKFVKNVVFNSISHE